MVPEEIRQAKWGWILAAGLAPPLVASLVMWLLPTLAVLATAGAAWWAARSVRGGLKPVHGAIIGFIAAGVGVFVFGGNDLVETLRFALTTAAGWLGVVIAGRGTTIVRPWQPPKWEQPSWEQKGEGV
ncbi:MAG: hypothetical protein ACRDJH_01900 [Thermomicrobiales bacterium]